MVYIVTNIILVYLYTNILMVSIASRDFLDQLVRAFLAMVGDGPRLHVHAVIGHAGGGNLA